MTSDAWRSRQLPGSATTVRRGEVMSSRERHGKDGSPGVDGAGVDTRRWWRVIATAVAGGIMVLAGLLVVILPWDTSESTEPPAAGKPPAGEQAPVASSIASPTSTVTEPAALTGTLYYYRWDGQRGHGQVLTVRDGTVERTDLLNDTLGTASVSPDGRRVAWASATGELTVAGIDGGNPRSIASDAVPFEFNVPAWTPDSAAVAFTAADGPVDGARTTIGPTERVSADGTGRQRIWQNGAMYLAWAADGDHLGFANGTGGAGVLDVAAGTETGPDLSAVGGTGYLAGVSPDGRRILTQLGRQDMGRRAAPLGLFDVASSTQIPLPVNGTVSGGLFMANGDLVLRVAGADGVTVSRLTPDGQVVGQTTEPGDLGEIALIGFTAH